MQNVNKYQIHFRAYVLPIAGSTLIALVLLLLRISPLLGRALPVHLVEEPPIAGVDGVTTAYAAEATDAPLWMRQFGSSGHDGAQSIAVDSGSVYVGGDVAETLPGQVGAGARDGFVRKYDLAGNEQWTRQFGTPQDDAVSGVAVSTKGVYLVGYTAGTLPGQSTAGGDDIFVRAYDTTGNELWTRQFGSDAADRAAQVASHDSDLYVVGYTDGALPGQTKTSQEGSSDTFVRKYDVAGNPIWTRQFTISDTSWGHAITVDKTGVYVAGSWRQRGGGSHVFVRKFDVEGKLLWTSQFSSEAQDLPASIATVDFGVVVVGNTFGTLPGQRNAGHVDAFVRAYDKAGNVLWTREFGTATSDSATSVVADASGIYVGGTTWGELLANANNGASDVFLRAFDKAGNELWTRQAGSGAEDRNYAIAANDAGFYLAGMTGDILPGQSSAGLSDCFVINYDRSAPSWRNQLRNGGFEAGKEQWQFYSDRPGYFTTAMAGYASDTAATINVAERAKNIQLYQSGFVLEPNTNYRLQFAAYSSTGHDLSIYLHQHSDPYKNYGLRNFRINLSKRWKVFTVDFTTKSFARQTDNTRLRFWLAPYAKAGDLYWIDEVSLTKRSPTVTAAAQVGFGTVEGAMADAEGGATVTLLDSDTAGARYQVAMPTDGAGAFQFAQVPWGPYELRIVPPTGYLVPEPVQLLVGEDANEAIIVTSEPVTNLIYLPQIAR